MNNKNHTLVVLGDLFDRGPETVELYNYLMTIPKERLILVKGNHEFLFKELTRKRFPDIYDFSNGTVRTFCSIARIPEENLKWSVDNEEPELWWNQVVDIVSTSKITAFVNDKSRWVNYLEIGPYVMVHSFIPLRLSDRYLMYRNYPSYYWSEEWLEFREEWRNATDYEWEDATWGCPWKLYLLGNFKEEELKGKRLICGHWHTGGPRGFYEGLKGEYGNKKSCLYYSHGIIGLDGGVQFNKSRTKLLHQQNVLIIDEDFKCYDKNQKELK